MNKQQLIVLFSRKRKNLSIPVIFFIFKFEKRRNLIRKITVVFVQQKIRLTKREKREREREREQ